MKTNDERNYELILSLARSRFPRTRGEGRIRATALAGEAYLNLPVGRLAQMSEVERVRYCSAVLRNLVISELRRPEPRRSRWTEVAAGLATRDSDPKPLDLGAEDALADLQRSDSRKAEAFRLMDLEGMDRRATSRALGVCERTVTRERGLAKAWLRTRISDEPAR